MAASAWGLATMGALLPLAYEQPYTEAYPVAGSKFVFKPGSMDIFLAKAQAFATAAEDLFKLADKEDKDVVTAQLPKLQGTCGACHAVFRGAN
jgi:cytochrome c556